MKEGGPKVGRGRRGLAKAGKRALGRFGGRTILGRIVVPVAAALMLLPPLSCLIFYQSATSYSRAEAERELSALQEQIAPIVESSFSDAGGGSVYDADPDAEGGSQDAVSSFLGQAGPAASQMGGDARLLVLAGRMQAVYPRNERLREAVAPLAQDFARFIQENGVPADGSVELRGSDGQTYLADIYEPPIRSQRLRYVIVYCPTAQIGDWVGEASVIVLCVSSAFALVGMLALCASARSIALPLRRLCREARRIGGGDFAEIEPEFPLEELEELRRSMNDMSQRLMRAEQSQKRFFQNVSHELRSPLMSIGGYAQGIEWGVFDPPHDAARAIMEESARLAEAVDGLLCLSRLDGEAAEPRVFPLRVGDAVRRHVERAQGLASARGVSIDASGIDVGIEALAEDELLGKVVDNLLSNAIRYARASVEVSVRAQGGAVEVRVADDGPGIAEVDLPHVFERCYKGEGGQFGLGLAIASSAASLMGASLQACSDSGSGAVFTLRLRSA